MKKYIVLVFLLITGMQSIAQFSISWPINGSVFQRSNSGNATVYFAGQANLSSASILEYRIATLNKYGGQVSVGGFINVGTVSASNSKIFRFQTTLSTGWYRADIQVRSSTGSFVGSSSVKFGIGEVFVIAGQSNAQGYGAETFGVLTTTTNNNTSNENLDCVRAFKNVQAFGNYDGNVGEVNDIVNLEIPVFGSLTYDNSTGSASTTNNNSWIGPTSLRTWYYQYLGNKIAKNLTPGAITPVMFFNVAFAGTSLNNWERSMKRVQEMFKVGGVKNYANNMNTSANAPLTTAAYPLQNPWGYPSSASESTMDPLFASLKNVISFYGNAFGIRAVLWHQGEAETKTMLNKVENGIYKNQNINPQTYNDNYIITDYNTKLKSIIDETRTILPGLNWAISLASLTTETTNSSSVKHYNIVNNYTKPGYSNLSWVYSSPSLTGNSLSPGVQISADALANVIKQQELLKTNNSTYITYFNTNSDSCANYSIPGSGGMGLRQVDGTHFGTLGLEKMATNSYNTMKATNGIFSKTPVSATAPPILNLAISGSQYVASLTPPIGVTYSKYQWETHYTFAYNKFNQANSSTTNSYSSPVAVNGYVKDTYGRIHIIPYANFANTGARMASELSSVAYPNPQVGKEFIKVKFEISKREDVALALITKEGKVIYQKPAENYQEGTYILEIPNSEIQNFENNQGKIVFLHLSKGNKVDKMKIILN
ncbi:MAG: hypothetical protein NXI00_02555 [Cytophagales bacterium]|nr:hypothetical protein [Cytophagales bacterium]